MNFYLSLVGFSPCQHSSDAEFVWSFVKQILLDCIDRFVPKITIKSNAHPKWFTANLRHKINCLRSLKKRYSRSPTPHIKEHIETVKLEIAEESMAAHSLL